MSELFQDFDELRKSKQNPYVIPGRGPGIPKPQSQNGVPVVGAGAAPRTPQADTGYVVKSYTDTGPPAGARMIASNMGSAPQMPVGKPTSLFPDKMTQTGAVQPAASFLARHQPKPVTTPKNPIPEDRRILGVMEGTIQVSSAQGIRHNCNVQYQYGGQ